MAQEASGTSVAYFDTEDLIDKIDEFQHEFRAEMALLHKKERGPDYLRNLTSYTEHAHNLGKCVVPKDLLTRYSQATANLIPGRLHVRWSPDSTQTGAKMVKREVLSSEYETFATTSSAYTDSKTVRNKTRQTVSDATVTSKKSKTSKEKQQSVRPRPMNLTTSELVQLYENGSGDTRKSSRENTPQRVLTVRGSRSGLGSRTSTHQISSSDSGLLTPQSGSVMEHPQISEFGPQASSHSLEAWMADDKDRKATLKSTSPALSASLENYQKEAVSSLSEPRSRGSSLSRDIRLNEAWSPLPGSRSPAPELQHIRVEKLSGLKPESGSEASTESLSIRIEKVPEDEGGNMLTPKSVLARNSRASLESQGSIRRLKSRPSGVLRPSSYQSLHRISGSSLQSGLSSTSSVDIRMKIAEESSEARG